MEDSKRIVKFKNELIKEIPKSPNNKDSKETLEEMSLIDVLIHYLNWKYRYVPLRKRKINIEPEITNDKHLPGLKESINCFFDKVRNGEDLTPHLSLQVHSKGFSPAAIRSEPHNDHWSDKDFLLNVMGYHHFHLGINIEPGGYVNRTDHVLFAKVSREELTAVAIVDHSVFDNENDELNDERKRIYQLFENHLTKNAPPNSLIIPPSITLSGHPTHVVSRAQDYFRIIKDIDPKLDDYSYILKLYEQAKLAIPKKPKLNWMIHFTDLVLYEKNHNVNLVLRFGIN